MSVELDFFGYYLVAINIIGFFLFLINSWLYDIVGPTSVDKLLTVTSLLGGSAGILLAILLFDRRIETGNMMSRVFIACVFTVQLVIFLIVRGYVSDTIRFDVWNFFSEKIVLVIYLVIINLVTFIAFLIDKIAAEEGLWRINNITLLLLAFFGGSIGCLVGMYLLRHKTKKDYFTVGIRLIMFMQVVVLFYLMNAAW